MAGSPFAGLGPVTIPGLTGLTNYSVVVRQECTPGVFSANSGAVNFSTPCAAGSCNYIVRIGDIFGDGWDGSQWELRQNGITVAVIGPQLAGGCGPVDIPVSICSGSAISLHWTVVGGFSTEKALQLFDPFSVLVYDYRGPATYTSCPGVNWTSANNTVPGVFPTLMYSGVSNCTPPACAQPTTVSASNATINTVDVNWTCPGCTGVFYVEYGPGLTPGTGAALAQEHWSQVALSSAAQLA
ncbi:MAG: hypothetical protein IPP33_00525 [Flavobacteriales bacterium]|nr:hypothetical protein [Flavobacteriales bacterium]